MYIKKKKTCQKEKTLDEHEVLTPTVEEHNVRVSCIAIRQKAVMEASESMPVTSPCTNKPCLFLSFYFGPNFPVIEINTHSHDGIPHFSFFRKQAVDFLCVEN